MPYDLENLIRAGILDIELSVPDPTVGGVSAGDGAIGFGSDKTRWIKLDIADTAWKRIVFSNELNWDLFEYSRTYNVGEKFRDDVVFKVYEVTTLFTSTSARLSGDPTAEYVDAADTNQCKVVFDFSAAPDACRDALALTEAARDTTLLSISAFDERYIGAFANDTLANAVTGVSIDVGDIYYNTSTLTLKFWDGVNWTTPISDIEAALSVTQTASANALFYALSAETYALSAETYATSIVDTDRIADLAITTPKIDNLAVTEAKINTGAVTEAKINTGAVTAGKIGSNAVTEAKINTGAVTVNKIGSNAVTEAKINTGAVTVNKIGSNAVTNVKIANDAITANKIDSTITIAVASLSSYDVEINDTSTVPTTPTTGGVMFVSAGDLKYIGSGGTITTIATA